MEGELWTLAFILALLKPPLHFFLDRTRGIGPEKLMGVIPQKQSFLQYFIIPWESQKIHFLRVLQETHSLEQGGDEDSIHNMVMIIAFSPIQWQCQISYYVWNASYLIWHTGDTISYSSYYYFNPASSPASKQMWYAYWIMLYMADTMSKRKYGKHERALCFWKRAVPSPQTFSVCDCNPTQRARTLASIWDCMYHSPCL